MKAKKLYPFVLIALMSISQILSAQSPSWKWVKWSNGTQTTVRSVCADASGNLHGAGTFNTSTKFDGTDLTSTGDAAFVVKYKSDGTVSWAKMVKNPGFAAIDCKSVAIDKDGNVYITGAYKGTIEFDTKTLTGSDHYVAKYNSSGAIQWAVNATGSNAIAANTSGVFVAGGSTIQKFDPSGTVTWSINGVKSNQGYTNFYSVALNSSGNLIVAGAIDDKWTFGSSVILGGYQNIVLMEVSSAGTVTWFKTFGSSTHQGDHVQHITLDGSNNIIMTGRVGGASMFDGVSLSSKNGYIVKLNSTGVAQWGSTITNSNTIYGEGGISVATNTAGDVYVTGGFGTLDVTDGGTTTYVKGVKAGGNAYILKFNASGVFQSALTNKENPTINNSRGMALSGTTSGVYFGGVCAPSSEWGSLKVTGYGSVFSKIEDGTTQNIKRFDHSNTAISVYPNPSNGYVTLDLTNTFNGYNNASVMVVNALGESVFKSEIQEEVTPFNLSGLPKGVYFLQVRTEGGLTIKKVILK